MCSWNLSLLDQKNQHRPSVFSHWSQKILLVSFSHCPCQGAGMGDSPQEPMVVFSSGSPSSLTLQVGHRMDKGMGAFQIVPGWVTYTHGSRDPDGRLGQCFWNHSKALSWDGALHPHHDLGSGLWVPGNVNNTIQWPFAAQRVFLPITLLDCNGHPSQTKGRLKYFRKQRESCGEHLRSISKVKIKDAVLLFFLSRITSCFLVLSVTACRVEMKYIWNICYTHAVEPYVLYIPHFDSEELWGAQLHGSTELSLAWPVTPNDVLPTYDWPFEKKSSPSPSPRGTDGSL